jgi:hypothetical protein
VKRGTLSILELIIIQVDASAYKLAYMDNISVIFFRYYPNRGSEATPFLIRGCSNWTRLYELHRIYRRGSHVISRAFAFYIELHFTPITLKSFICVEMCNSEMRPHNELY